MNRPATTHELQLLLQSAREAVQSLYRGWPDDEWPDSWAGNWDTLAGLGYVQWRFRRRRCRFITADGLRDSPAVPAS